MAEAIRRLPHLPIEVWETVFGTFRANNDIGGLAALCRTCKLFNGIVTPELYKVFDTELLGFDAMSPVKFNGLVAFLRAVAGNNWLASLVTELKVHAYTYSRSFIANLALEDKALLEDLSIRLGVQDLIGDMTELLLCMLFNVKSIYLSYYDDPRSESFLSRWIEKTPSNRLWALTTLKVRRFPGQVGERRRSLIINRALFGDLIAVAPKIETLTLQYHCLTDTELMMANLKELNITDCHLIISEITNILRHTYHLETFRYHPGGIFGTVRPRSNALQTIAALSRYRDTLKVLDLQPRILCNQQPVSAQDWDNDTMMYIDDDMTGSIGDALQKIALLHTIKLSQGIIYGARGPDASTSGSLLTRTLPRSLNRLHLSDVRVHLFEDIRQFAHDVAQGEFPKLESVELVAVSTRSFLSSLPREVKASSIKQIEAIRGLFRDAGVGFHFKC
ncbi:hypothetical protein F5X99DRAFT_375021 [Biscogniauxia marginata]|nr:hypothetical protein F5X99DRAFT_375021 [Biscogniauxia marginata]